MKGLIFGATLCTLLSCGYETNIKTSIADINNDGYPDFTVKVIRFGSEVKCENYVSVVNGEGDYHYEKQECK